jgi:hypothetical protein
MDPGQMGFRRWADAGNIRGLLEPNANDPER